MAFQRAASKRLNEGLKAKESAVSVVRGLNEMYRSSLPDHGRREDTRRHGAWRTGEAR
jgi:hypothetical protein